MPFTILSVAALESALCYWWILNLHACFYPRHGFENLSGAEVKPPHQHFSNLFNSYAQAFNKRTGRHGSLFERPFKRKTIDNEGYLKQVVLYIHNNLVHHGFCSHPLNIPGVVTSLAFQ